MDSFVGRSHDISVINGRRRKVVIFVLICIACVITAGGIFFLLLHSFMNRQYIHHMKY